MKNRECFKIQRTVDELEAEQLPPVVTAHLARCLECRRHFDDLLRLQSLVRDAQRVTVPDDFDRRLRERLQSRAERPAPLWAWWAAIPTPAMAAAAAIVLFASVTVTIWQNRSDVSEDSSHVAAIPAAPSKTVSVPPPVEAVKAKPATASNRGELDRTIARTSERNVSTERVARLRPQSQTAAVPEVMLLLRDSQYGEQVVRVPQVIIGAKQIVPNEATVQRASYEPNVF